MKSLMILIFVLLSQGVLLSQIYKYPVKPDTKKWPTLKTEEERIAALQIPDSILSGMTTNELVQACLNYPAFFHFAFFDDLQSGMVAIILRFNGIRELMRRKDAGEKLLSIYTKTNTNGYNDKNLQCTEEYWPLRFMFIELILAQETILYAMPEHLQKQLLQKCLEKITMKLNNEFYSLYDCQSTALIMVRLLKRIDNPGYHNLLKENYELDQFSKTGSLNDIQAFQLIIEYSNSYLNQNNIY